jgi:hypothetical protein
MKIKRKPKPWASQLIFFDIITFSRNGSEISRRASFICKKCRHICEWEDDSEAFRCESCGRKLTAYGATEILNRYEPQFSRLRTFCKQKKKRKFAARR